MRKLISTCLLTLIVSGLSAQKTLMRIRLADSSVHPSVESGLVTLDAALVDGISFEVSPLPESLEAVDLGLTSGLLWSNLNFGANAVTQPGDLYTASGVVGALPTLEDNEDIVNLTWGKPYNEKWRMPSSEEIQELIDECNWTWNDNGYTVKGRNGKSIFLPATKIWRNGNYEESGSGYMWSSDVVDGRDDGRYLTFNQNGKDLKAITSAVRNYGLAIRPVYGDASTGNYKRPKAVELGLSVKWASYNLGAESEYEPGGLYGWGDPTGELTENVPGHYGVYETESVTRTEVRQATIFGGQIVYCDLNTGDIIDTSAGTIEEVTVNGTTKYYYVETHVVRTLLYGENIAGRDSFDVVAAQLGGNWRMPSRAEINELKQCRWEFVSNYGSQKLKGYKVYGIGAYSSNYIFIPNAGYRRENTRFDDGVRACWWSSENNYSAQAYYFYVSPTMSELTGSKALGLSIRPVCPSDGSSETSETDKTWQYTQGTEGIIIPKDGVDLGLSVKWANWNLGAKKTKGDVGNYYAWGELSTKSSFTLSNYSIDDGYMNVKDKPLDDAHDAAHALWGGQWYMPTEDQFLELRSNCQMDFVTEEGLSGYRFTSNINGKSIFIPAAGVKQGTSLSNLNSEGNYWNRTDWFTSNDEKARTWASSLFFTESYEPAISGNPRDWGLTIRPVMKK